MAISIARFKESFSISPSRFVTPNLVGIYSQGSVGHNRLRTKTNREPAIESHASSIHRAWPVKRASAAPIVAIKSAKPARAQATRIRLSLNDLINLPLARAISGTTGRANHRRDTGRYTERPRGSDVPPSVTI